MSFNDYWSVEEIFSEYDGMDDIYDGLTLDDVLTDEEKEAIAYRKERELFWSPPSMESLDISYRD